MTALRGSEVFNIILKINVQKLAENYRLWRVQQLQGLIEKENSDERFFKISV